MEKEKEIMIKKMVESGITIEDFIDFIIEKNGIIGVGLITLSDYLTGFIYSKRNYKS